MSFDKKQYDQEYNKNAYDRIVVNVPKGKRIIVKQCADRQGMSVNALVIDALEQLYKLNLGKDE